MKSRQHQQFRNAGAPLLGGFLVRLSWLVAASLWAESALPIPDPPELNFGESASSQPATSEDAEGELRFYIKQIRVRGSKLLTNAEIETAIYPFLGPGRTLTDLELARTALEKVFRDKGYQTVAVELPQQNGTRGIIYMNVIENRIGRVNVTGARFFLPSEIKQAAPSMAEGQVPNFNDVTRDLVALNAWPERQVSPSIRPGIAPNTVDIDLEVKDKAPLHGSVDLNNRYVANTTELRLDTSFSYANLWQRGHTFGMSTQISPQNLDDSMVVSAFYLARFPQLSKFSLQLMANQQDSLIATAGGLASLGNGTTTGIRGIFQLPGRGIYFHSLSAGFDYKSFLNSVDKAPGFNEADPDLVAALEAESRAIHYYPITVAYGGGWSGKNFFTEFNAALQFHFRGLGSDLENFDFQRFDSDGGWMSLRSDIAHTQDLPKDFQVFAKFQTQLTNNALIFNEQLVIGGASTVRGYLDATALGDNGWTFNFEVRTPSLISAKGTSEGGSPESEFRFRTFFDAGTVYVNEALPEQQDVFELASFGFGTTIDLWNHFSGTLDLAWPLVSQGTTLQHEPFLSFQVGSEF